MKDKGKPEKDRHSVQTVKLDDELFLRLKMFAARTRRTNQDILHTALVEYLKKMKA